MKFQLRIIAFLTVALILSSSCKKNKTAAAEPTVNPDLPVITIGAVSAISDTSAKYSGNASSEGTSVITAVGVCWDEQPGPTLLRSKTNDGAGVGSFTSSLSALKPNTTYYVRAYATNGHGTAYSDEVTFKTLDRWSLSPLSITDNIRGFASIGTNLFAITNASGVFLSTTNGTTWKAVNTGLTDLTSTSIVAKDGILFVSTSASGVFSSSDNGTNWSPCNTGITNLKTKELLVSGTNLFLASTSDLFMSTNNGGLWTKVTPGTNVAITNMCLSGTSLLAYANLTHSIYISNDNGSSWMPQSKTPTGNCYKLKKFGSRLYLGTDVGAYSSEDNGVTWTKLAIFGTLPVCDFTMRSTTIYASYYGSVLSTENNTTWSAVSRGIPKNGIVVSTFIHQDIMFVAVIYSAHVGEIYKLQL